MNILSKVSFLARRALATLGAGLFMVVCHGLAAASGYAAYHYGGFVALGLWVVLCWFLGDRYAPNGWDDV